MRNATARVTKPSGVVVDVPLKFTTLNSVNTYAGEFKADELGQHRIELSGQHEFIMSAIKHARERFESGVLQRRTEHDLLKRISAETGGKYYTPAEAQSLVDDLIYRQSPYSERVTKDLWDMPINFMLIIGLLSAEWFLRKREGWLSHKDAQNNNLIRVFNVAGRGGVCADADEEEVSYRSE